MNFEQKYTSWHKQSNVEKNLINHDSDIDPVHRPNLDGAEINSFLPNGMLSSIKSRIDEKANINYSRKKKPLLVQSFTSDCSFEYESNYDESSDDDDDIDDFNHLSIFELASAIYGDSGVEEELLLAKHGYVKQENICKTLQGQLFMAVRSDNGQRVAIKQTPKESHSKKEAELDGFRFVVDEDIVKEALILRHLSCNNTSIGGVIVKFIEFFESDTDYYLVTEYIENSMTLKEFVTKSHQYIKNGKLDSKQYKKIIKHLLWQLTASVHWLHNDMNCCHLDISPENIVLSNCEFPENPDGTVSIAPGIGLKLVDFGVSELFDNLFGAEPASFQCKKCHISPDNEQYLSPNIRQQNDYDGRAADMWSIGIIMFFSVFGEYPYKTMEETDFGGYWAIHNGKLEKYLRMENLLNMLSSNMLSLLNGLLNIDETQRLDSVKVLQHGWFTKYYQRYSGQINKKSVLQRKQLLNQKEKLANFPYYV